MAILWGELLKLYDAQAVKKYGYVGGETFNYWSERLSDLTQDDIKRGLENCLKDDSEYAPGLKKFRALCFNTKTGLTHNTAAYEIVKPSKRLTKKTDPGKARVHLNTIKQALKG